MFLFLVQLIAAFSGHRLWPVSFLLFGHRQWRPLSVVFIHYVISLGTACGDLVFCSVTDFCPSSGTASGDPFVPFDLITSFLWVLPVATYIHTYIHTYTHTHIHTYLLFVRRKLRQLSFHLIASFLWAPPVATQFSVVIRTYIRSYV